MADVVARGETAVAAGDHSGRPSDATRVPTAFQNAGFGNAPMNALSASDARGNPHGLQERQR